jgi:hypothetical protein
MTTTAAMMARIAAAVTGHTTTSEVTGRAGSNSNDVNAAANQNGRESANTKTKKVSGDRFTEVLGIMTDGILSASPGSSPPHLFYLRDEKPGGC